ncbi:MAG TPA: dihydropteroate synthase [Cyclobacteriaceae bacterium]|nr:dihydropteroate synthase [Cyclobacteriaceae bacterium]
MQNSGFSTNNTWNVRGRLVDFSEPKIMGILNLTPDSFYDGSRYNENFSTAMAQVEKMITDGADMIDIGGYSSRPGADDISADEEARRVVDVIAATAKQFPGIPVSIDTFRSGVAQKALDAGAAIINDITGGDRDPGLRKLAIRYQVPYIIMHMRGTPKDMNQKTGYEDVVKEVLTALQKKVNEFAQEGLTDVAVDPGFGFAKNVGQNFTMLNNLSVFRVMGKPVLVGISRKSMIWRTLETTAGEALNGTTALNMVALMKGASILRVHDVKEAKECVKLFKRLNP